MKKIITCTGYGTTGSSVVTDLLKEFDDVYSFGDYEYRFLFDPNGVRELEIALRYLNNRQNSDYYLKKFLEFTKYLSTSPMYKYYERTFHNNFYSESKKFIEKLIDVEWDGYWHRDIMSENIIRKGLYYFERVIQKKILKKEGGANFYKKKMFYSSYDEERFIENVNIYIQNLISYTNRSEKNLVFDQLLPPENLKDFSKYFNNIKIILVDRDPRDIFTLEKCVYKDLFGPYKDVKKYVEWYRKIREHRKIDENLSNVIIVNFEDFIYFYEKTIGQVIEFLEISEEDWKLRGKYFKPEVSINNTKTWEKYPELKDDIEYIEKELGEFIYNYNKKKGE